MRFKLAKKVLTGTNTVATPATTFRKFGYKSDSPLKSKRYIYWSIVVLDDAYQRLKDYCKEYQFHREQKKLANECIELFRSYFRYILGPDLDDTDVRILDDFDELQAEAFFQLRATTYALCNHNYRYFPTTEACERYCKLLIIAAEVSIAKTICDCQHIETDRQHDLIIRKLERWLDYVTVRAATDEYETDLLQRTSQSFVQTYYTYINNHHK